MQKAGWKIDQNDEACYIDIDEEEERSTDDLEREYSDWNYLPVNLLEEVFSYLTVKEKYYASLVCKNWTDVFYSPYIWNNFVIDDRTLTRTKYNYYSGWQYTIDHARTHTCLSRVGPIIRGISFQPLHSFNNIFQFMTILSWCLDRSQHPKCEPENKDIGKNIISLSYDFPCSMSQCDDRENLKLFGTGGEMLRTLKILLSKLRKLQTLKLTDLVLERFEANRLLDEIAENCHFTLRHLNIVNVTVVHCPILHIGCFFNLQVLEISPQNIDDDVITLIADSRIAHLHLVQNKHTPTAISLSCCSGKAWRIVKRDNPHLKVHLRVESTNCGEFVFQPEAPVHSIVYRTPKTKISPETILRIIDNYKTTLTSFGHELLPKFTSSKSFNSRCDSLLVLLARECRQLRKLVVREKVSTSTVLLLVRSAPNLKDFCVRKNAVILRCDWPKNPEWSNDMHDWIRRNSKSYSLVENAVSEILGRKWSFLSDKEFKGIC